MAAVSMHLFALLKGIQSHLLFGNNQAAGVSQSTEYDASNSTGRNLKLGSVTFTQSRAVYICEATNSAGSDTLTATPSSQSIANKGRLLERLLVAFS
eukprot:m.85553 g.85553  ORF g.85553 m.85553 type:complete len:97 (+) comp36448_c1_seq2:753-1043(+)